MSDADHDRAETEDAALLALLGALRTRGYAFTAPTPETHRRVLARGDKARARDLRDVFGWSARFDREVVGEELLTLMRRAGVLDETGPALASRVRVASLDDRLFLHSAYPPAGEDAVFFGPDSYRFAAFLRRELGRSPEPARLVDIGTGSGVGAVVAAALRPGARVLATDVNARALRLAAVNAAFAEVEVEMRATSGLEGVEGAFDIVVANPPYIGGDTQRTYRAGGQMLGAQVSVDWARSAMARLAPSGRLLLYTGAAIVGGEDRLRRALEEAAGGADGAFDLSYEELDPDVFGEQLDDPAYREAERIAVVGAVVVRRG